MEEFPYLISIIPSRLSLSSPPSCFLAPWSYSGFCPFLVDIIIFLVSVVDNHLVRKSVEWLEDTGMWKGRYKGVGKAVSLSDAVAVKKLLRFEEREMEV